MKLPHTTVSRFWVLLLSVFTLATAAYGQKANVVYNPTSVGAGGVVPFLHSYTITVTSPPALPPGESWAVARPLSAAATGIPNPAVDPATAAGWVRLVPDSLTFSGPNETQTVTITVDIPETALSGDVPSGQYTFLVKAGNWPSGVNNPGHRIDASVQRPRPPDEEGKPPVIEITEPISSTLTYPPGAFPQPVPFKFVATVVEGSPVITSVSAEFRTPAGTEVLTTENVGLDTRLVNGSGTFIVTGPGVYTLKCTARNSVGEDVHEEDYLVVVQGVPPTVVINTPSVGQTYTYRVGGPAVEVPFTFTATSNFGGIRSLTALVDGLEVPFSPQGLNTLTATGVISLPYTTAGTHTIAVVTSDDYGVDDDAGHFIVNVVAPEPTIVITTPYEGQEFTVPVGSTTTSVPYSFTAQVGNGFNIDSVTATLGVTTLAPTVVGLDTPISTGTSTLQLAPGTYEITAKGGSFGYFATDKVTFKVTAAATPPTVVINSPANGYSVELLPGGTVSVPFTFTGSSTTPGAVITGLTATLDGVPVSFTSTTLNTPVAVGTATLTFNAAGSHTLYVTATDAHGTAQATGSFTITAAQPRSVSGNVFFDVNANGLMDGADYGLAGVTVKLLNSSGGTLATLTSSPTGSYTFPGLFPGDYTVKATADAGFTATTPTSRPVTVAGVNVTAPAIGYTLDFCAISAMAANGFSHGFWKNNVAKAIQGKSAQIPAAAINAYTNSIAAFALSPFDGLTKQTAVAIMSSTSSKPADLLALQLVASEYNYQNKAYLSGNAVLTYAFVYWGEWVLANAGTLPATKVLAAKDWFDRYNNTHGSVMGGDGGCGGSTPPPPPPTGGDDDDCDRDYDRDRDHDRDCDRDRDYDRDRDCDRDDDRDGRDDDRDHRSGKDGHGDGHKDDNKGKGRGRG